jgi:nitronate monooxygenase
MRNFELWTCGHYTYRLKDTTRRLADGSYQLLSAEHVFNDYRYSKGSAIALPAEVA